MSGDGSDSESGGPSTGKVLFDGDGGELLTLAEVQGVYNRVTHPHTKYN